MKTDFKWFNVKSEKRKENRRILNIAVVLSHTNWLRVLSIWETEREIQTKIQFSFSLKISLVFVYNRSIGVRKRVRSFQTFGLCLYGQYAIHAIIHRYSNDKPYHVDAVNTCHHVLWEMSFQSALFFRLIIQLFAFILTLFFVRDVKTTANVPYESM